MKRTTAITTIKNMIAQESRAKRIIRGMRHRLKAEHRTGHECACQRKHAAINGDMADSRRTLRALHLAYAYLRGVPYAIVERKCRTAPNSCGVAGTIWELLDAKVPQQPLDADIKAWLAGKAPAWPSFPGEALVRYRRLMSALDRAADNEHYGMLAGRGDAVWAVLIHEERVLIENEEEAAAAAGRAA